MAICETCGATFTPSLERAEVTSLRILCSACEEKRRAEKALRASTQSGPAAPKAASGASTTASTTIRAVGRTPGTTAAKPAAAARPAASANSGASTNSSPAAKPASPARNAASGNSRATSRRERPSSSKESESKSGAGRRIASSPPASRKSRPTPTPAQARELHGKVSKKLLHRPVQGKTEANHAGEGFHPDVSREISLLKERESKVMRIAWIVCGVLILAAAGFGMAAKMKHDREVAAAKKHRDDLDTFLVEAKKFDIKSEESALKFLAFLEDGKKYGWETDDGAGGVGAEVGSLLSLAKANIEHEREKKEQMDRLANIEATLSDASGRALDDLLKARRTLDTLVLKDTAYGEEFKARVQAQVKTVDKIVLARYRQEAKTLAGGGPDKMRSALLAYSKAEDEATKLLDGAMRQKDEETKKFYTEQFKELMDESNAYVGGVFDEGMINSTAWTDLLTEDRKKDWQNYGMKGFRVEGGKLEAIGPTGGATNGLIAIPAAGGYRDFVVDMEFTIKGTVDMLFRLGKRVDNTVEYWGLSTTGTEPLKEGQTYTLQTAYIGSKLTGSLTPSDVSLPQTESSWTKSRKGALGFQMHDGSELRITRLRIRQLRDA